MGTEQQIWEHESFARFQELQAVQDGVSHFTSPCKSSSALFLAICLGCKPCGYRPGTPWFRVSRIGKAVRRYQNIQVLTTVPELKADREAEQSPAAVLCLQAHSM